MYLIKLFKKQAPNFYCMSIPRCTESPYIAVCFPHHSDGLWSGEAAGPQSDTGAANMK